VLSVSAEAAAAAIVGGPAPSGSAAVDRIGVRVLRAEPTRALPPTVLGGLSGLLAGWLLIGWLARRRLGHGPVLRAGLVPLAAAGLAALLPTTAWTQPESCCPMCTIRSRCCRSRPGAPIEPYELLATAAAWRAARST
jgi:hypothetical protein